MNTLRAKIAVLLVVAIVSVVGLLTVVLFYLLGPPKHRHSLTPVAQQVETLLRIAKEGKTGVLKLVPEPAPSSVDERIAAALAGADRPRPFADLRACCRIRTATLYARLAAMTAAGRIVKAGDGYHLAGH